MNLPWVVLAVRDTGKWFTSSYHEHEDQAHAAARRFKLELPDAETEVTTAPNRRVVLDALNADLMALRPGRWPDRPGNPRVDELVRIAAEFSVTADTLGQYVSRSGTYAKARSSRSPRSDSRLPAWGSPESADLAARVEEACRPWTPRYVGVLSRSCRRTDSEMPA